MRGYAFNERKSYALRKLGPHVACPPAATRSSTLSLWKLGRRARGSERMPPLPTARELDQAARMMVGSTRGHSEGVRGSEVCHSHAAGSVKGAISKGHLEGTGAG